MSVMRVSTRIGIMMLVITAISGQERTSWMHTFRLWGKVNEHEKMVLLCGITNGFFVGASGGVRASGGLLTSGCQDKITVEQAVAMVDNDRRYRDNPEQWDTPLGIAVIKAITVKGGPCEKYSEDPWSSTPQSPTGQAK